MRISVAAIAVTVWLGMVSPGALADGADEKGEPGAVVLSPREGQEVDQFDEVEGEIKTAEGWPVVMIQPQLSGQPWWVQAPIDEVESKKFRCQCQFGDAMTPPGTKFRIVVFVARNRTEAHDKYTQGMTRPALPPRLPYSKYVTVRRK